MLRRSFQVGPLWVKTPAPSPRFGLALGSRHYVPLSEIASDLLALPRRPVTTEGAQVSAAEPAAVVVEVESDDEDCEGDDGGADDAADSDWMAAGSGGSSGSPDESLSESDGDFKPGKRPRKNKAPEKKKGKAR